MSQTIKRILCYHKLDIIQVNELCSEIIWKCSKCGELYVHNYKLNYGFYTDKYPIL